MLKYLEKTAWRLRKFETRKYGFFDVLFISWDSFVRWCRGLLVMCTARPNCAWNFQTINLFRSKQCAPYHTRSWLSMKCAMTRSTSSGCLFVYVNVVSILLIGLVCEGKKLSGTCLSKIIAHSGLFGTNTAYRLSPGFKRMTNSWVTPGKMTQDVNGR